MSIATEIEASIEENRRAERNAKARARRFQKRAVPAGAVIRRYKVTINGFDVDLDAFDWQDAVREWHARVPRVYQPEKDSDHVSIVVEARS